MKPSEILTQAQTEIRTRGWCQGDMMNAQGAVCAMGAVRAAATHLGLSGKWRSVPSGARTFLYDEEEDATNELAVVDADMYLLRVTWDAYTSVPSFNDAPETTEATVLTKLAAAAERAKLDDQ